MDVDLRFKHPFSAVVAAASMGGKTSFVSRLVENFGEMCTVKPDRIIWCYSEWQQSYDKIIQIPGVDMVEGLPDIQDLRNDPRSKLLICDDLMAELSKSPILTTLFTRGCHHWSTSIIMLVQNVFYSNLRNARINTTYIVIFKSPGDKVGITTLARQLYPGKTKYFMQAFADATSIPYGYLLIDLTQTMDDKLRLRTGIFPGETCFAYLPKV